LLSNTVGPTHSAMADFGSEYTPGLIDAAGNATDVPGTNQTYYVYKISQDDLRQPGRDYLNWPVSQGAPLNSEGNPLLIGDQTLYCTFYAAYEGTITMECGSALDLQADVRNA